MQFRLSAMLPADTRTALSGSSILCLMQKLQQDSRGIIIMRTGPPTRPVQLRLQRQTMQHLHATSKRHPLCSSPPTPQSPTPFLPWRLWRDAGRCRGRPLHQPLLCT